MAERTGATETSSIGAVADEAPSTGGSPMLVTFDGPPSPQPGSLHVALVVERRVAIPAPLTIAIRVPAGVTLVSPASQLSLPQNSAAATDRVELVLNATSIPETDLVVTIDAQGDAMGVHGVYAYRFGRPEPVGSTPQLAAESLVIGGHDLGRPVVVAPQ